MTDIEPNFWALTNELFTAAVTDADLDMILDDDSGLSI
jgi:hypothetical protein